MKPFVKGDLDGFFALGLDNLLMLILMSSVCLGFLQFTPELFYGRILPATAIGLIIGNLFYARQALKLAAKEGRDDVCAIPYGVSLLTIFVFAFLVMYPAQQAALAGALEQGMSPQKAKEFADTVAWHAGLMACLGSGLIEFVGSFVVEQIRRVTPRAALLSALASIGVFFIAMDFLFRAYAFPIVGFTTLAITLVIYFGRAVFRGGVPGGLVILTLGTVLAWIFYRGEGGIVPVGELRWENVALHLPIPVIGDLFASFQYLVPYLPVILPMGFINLVLSLQNIESAAAAGDRYESRPALAFNGLGTIGASLFGSPFPTTIYIGHPGWKGIGARAGYSTLNAIVMSIIAFTGSLSIIVYFVPVEAGMAILIWIGIMMGTQAFNATPAKHAPAVVIGLMPGCGAFAALILKNTLAAMGYGGTEGPFPSEVVGSMFAIRGYSADGILALEQGYVYTSMILAAATVCIIERQFYRAAFWALAGAGLTFIGFVHAYEFQFADVVGVILPGPEWFSDDPAPGLKWFLGYLIFAAILAITPFITRESASEPLI